ncbi:MAG: glutaminyl-peptide cyclotransferase [Lishizhenia sp.]
MRNYFLLIAILSLYALAITGCKEERKGQELTQQKVKTRILAPKNGKLITKGNALTLSATFNLDEAENYSIYVNDSVVGSLPDLKERIELAINASYFKLGSNKIVLKTGKKEGGFLSDTRTIKVVSDQAPEIIEAEAVSVHPHQTSSYTQGLEFYEGDLFEGTGQYGSSALLKTKLNSGEILKQTTLSSQFFGEGITILNGTVYQLTWKSKKGFTYDVNTLEKTGEFFYNSEGWGLTNDGRFIIMSDGTERIYFRDPATFKIVKQIEVYTHKGALTNLNELEYINGKLYANIYTTNQIAVINPENGVVEQIIDASLLALEYRKNGEVLNGIAYNSLNQKLYLTGKNWPHLLEVVVK